MLFLAVQSGTKLCYSFCLVYTLLLDTVAHNFSWCLRWLSGCITDKSCCSWILLIYPVLCFTHALIFLQHVLPSVHFNLIKAIQVFLLTHSSVSCHCGWHTLPFCYADLQPGIAFDHWLYSNHLIHFVNPANSSSIFFFHTEFQASLTMQASAE